jgi:two-component system cell cycle sensor histidine kinase/response regulator CckA
MADILTGKLETILVVDDNEALCKYVVAILEQAHFHVLSAENGANAIELAKQTVGRIDLLLSDLDMPLMSGPDLGQALKKTRPDIHVMLMSGGAGGNLLVLNYGWAFIEEPFIAKKLVQMVTDVLHSPDRSQLGGKEFDSHQDTQKAMAATQGPSGQQS